MPYAQLQATERTAEGASGDGTEPKGALCFCSRGVSVICRNRYLQICRNRYLQKPNPLEQSQYLSVRTVLEHPQSGASMRDGAKKN
jgi:hypothetical protein